MYNVFLTHPQAEITKPTNPWIVIYMLRSLWKKKKKTKFKQGIMKLLQQNYGFVWDHSTVCLHYGHKCKINFWVSSISMWNIFVCNGWRTSQPFDKQASSSLHRPSFNSLPTPCHSSYLSFGALALTVANNTAHIPSTPLFLFQVPDNLDIGAPTL